MTQPLRYTDSPFRSKCHKFEAGLRIIHVTTASQYHGDMETTWYVRCPVTGKELAARWSEESARARAREIAMEREGLAA